MRAALSILLVTTVAATSSCKKAEEEAPLRDAYTYSIAFEGEPALPTMPGGVPLLVNGKEVGAIERYVRVELPAGTWLSDDATKLAVRLPSTCGPVEVPVKATLSRATEVDQRKGDAVSVRLELEKPLELATVYVDNVKGTAASTMALGKHVPVVAPGQKWKGKVLLGPCLEGKQVRLGKEDVGPITTTKYEATLVDAVGGTCYELDYVTYHVDPSAMADRADDPPKHYAGGRAYAVREVDHFLEEAPPTKKVEGSLDVVGVLRHVDCKKVGK